MAEWMKAWGQFITLLIAMAGLFGWGFNALREESSVLREEIVLNRQAIEANQEAINALGREVSELRGEPKGHDLIVGEEDR